uniref:Uncharacterized protein n=1 Tax=Rhizophora mucronata TaxID=61149 RepID=A0A2P2MAI9_RHIMU
MVTKDHIHCFRVIQVLFIQPLLVPLGTLFFPLQQIRRFDYGAQS